MSINVYSDLSPEIMNLSRLARDTSAINPELYTKYEVKTGPTDINGKGVLAGLTDISAITAYTIEDNEMIPCEGKLYYRGIDIHQLVNGFVSEKRFGFEEIAYCSCSGSFPPGQKASVLYEPAGQLPHPSTSFVRDIIMKAPSQDMMNTLARSVLTLYSYDDRADDTSIPNVLRQCLELISLFPLLSIYGYQAYSHYHDGKSLFIHSPEAGAFRLAKISCTSCARTANTRILKRGSWISLWCCTWSTAAVITPPSRPMCRIFLRHGHLLHHCGSSGLLKKAPSTAAPMSKW